MAFEVVDAAQYSRDATARLFSVKVDSVHGIFNIVDHPEEWDEEREPEETFDLELMLQKQAELIKIAPSEFTEFAIRVPLQEEHKLVPFSFEQRRYLRQIYDTPAKRTLLKSGRQVEKSTLLGNKLLSYSCIVPSLQSLYVSPTNLQSKTFSSDRLNEPIQTSEYLKSWTTTKLSDNIFLKQFINRSKITLRYAYLNADRCRGIPANVICLDEIQDLMTENIPIIEECASHSPPELKRSIYSGTPKSLDNTIESYWTKYSTQNEWVVPCHRHSFKTPAGFVKGYYNVLTEDNIGPTSLICERCKKPISAEDEMAHWASMNPHIRQVMKEEPYEGYRISQLMVPWLDWNNILQKQQTYERLKFFNEVLGLSYDSGQRPLTQQDVYDNCDPRVSLDPNFQEQLRGQLSSANPVYMGLDWGCHDEETRILTPRGFVHFRDLTDEDKVAQWDPDTREMTFVTPKARTIRDWDQPMLHFKGKAMDMMLTHTHRMRVNTQQGGEWGHWLTESAGETAERGGNVKFAGSVRWKGEEVKTFTLPGLPVSPGYSGSKDLVVPMDLWLEFLGYYLSEGGLCYDGNRPSCIKMSQRESVNWDNTQKIRACLRRLDLHVQEFPNPKTSDINWTIYGKQLWQWVLENIGPTGDVKRIPRQFMNLSERQLKILFRALMLGDGSVDPREENFNGYYGSTSKGLCEDFQELCIRLGLRSTTSLHKPASEGRKARWRTSWSAGDDLYFKTPNQRVETVPYKGKVYCCAVPSGYIVTERHGRIAYQGNTGENTYTVLSLGTYLNAKFTIFYIHRFEGRQTEPEVQLNEIMRIAQKWKVQLIGCDYGGGFDRNDWLIRHLGHNRILKYQYSTPGEKVKYDQKLGRHIVHRTEVMSDIFNAIKRRDVFRFPRWEEFKIPFAADCLNIFAEYSEQRRMNEYKKSLGCTDDAFHSILYCFLASMYLHPRPDVIHPRAADGS